MLDWVIAWAGLYAIWMLEDKSDAHLPLKIGEIAINIRSQMR